MKNYPQDADASVQNKNKTGSEGDSAAAPFLQGVKVKKLEWVEPSKETNGCWIAKCEIGTYSVVNENGWYATLDEHAWGTKGFEWASNDLSKDTRQTAFDAAQADYEARVLSAIEVSALDPSPRAQALEEEEFAIDKLRFRAFHTNSEADRQAYFYAVSKWFQDRHYRRMDAERALSSQPVADHVADAGKMVADGCKGEWREIEYNHALKGRRVNPAYFPSTGEVCEISGPNCDDDKGYTWGETTVLWQNEMFVLYGKTGCWPVLHKHEHVLFRPLPASPEVSG